MHYLAMQYGYNAANHLDMYTGEHIYARFLEDFSMKYLFKARSMPDTDPNKKEFVAELFKTHYPAFLQSFESVLKGADCKFILGQRLTMYDFYLGGFFFNHVKNPLNPFAQQWAESKAPPKVEKYIKDFEEQMHEYL